MPDGSYAVCSTKLEHLSVGVDLCSQAFIALCVAACTVYFCFVFFFYFYFGGALARVFGVVAVGVVL